MYTLLRHEDVKHFKGMLRKADNTYVRDHRLDRAAMEGLREGVEQALERMQVKKDAVHAGAEEGASEGVGGWMHAWAHARAAGQQVLSGWGAGR